MQSAQGKVRALHKLESGIVMADIDWNKPGLPKRANIKNLTRMEDARVARQGGIDS
jgi:hypothetical protein